MILFALTLWKILGIIAAISLIFFFKGGKNAVWGGITTGGIIGVVAAFFREGNYDWYFVLKFVIIGVLSGVVLELLSNFKKRK